MSREEALYVAVGLVAIFLVCLLGVFAGGMG